jgi:PilZ domain
MHRDNVLSCSGGSTPAMSRLIGRQIRTIVMGKINDSALPPDRPEQRKHRRFAVSYPVKVKWRLENSVSELQAVTKNVSVGGLLLETASPVPQDCPVDFIMTLHGGHVTRPIPVIGEGQVVRVEPHGPGAGFAVAIKCKREIELNLSGLAS